MKTGIELIAEERQEQIEKHGRTIEKDIAENKNNQLNKAASILCEEYPVGCLEVDDIEIDFLPENWDANIWNKMVNKTYKQRLIIAGALIAAEIDRINQEKL